MSDSTEEKNLTVRVPPELHKALRRWVNEEDTSFQEILLTALKRWLEEREAGGKVKTKTERKLSDEALSDEEETYIRRLLAILRSPYTDARAAVMQNIDVFHRYASPGRGKARKN